MTEKVDEPKIGNLEEICVWVLSHRDVKSFSNGLPEIQNYWKMK